MQGFWSGAKKRRSRIHRVPALAVAIVTLICIAALGQSPERSGGNAGVQEILAYIHSGWDSLTRSTTSCSGISDPKVSVAPVLYLPASFGKPSEVDQMQRDCGIRVVYLPQVIHQLGTNEVDSIQPPGLLYLKNKYVVPGGRFNEMYGWDSVYWARPPTPCTGRVWQRPANAWCKNTYGMSGKAFSSIMTSKITDDRAWLEKAYGYVKRDYVMWTQDPHLAGSTGLSRYYDFGEGPAMEALQDENDIYRQVAAYFLFHPAVPAVEGEAVDVPDGRASGSTYSVRVCSAGQSQSSCEAEHFVKLKPDYYKGSTGQDLRHPALAESGRGPQTPGAKIPME